MNQSLVYRTTMPIRPTAFTGALALMTLAIGSSPLLAQNGFGSRITQPRVLNSNAYTDAGQDYAPQIKTDQNGLWLAIWRSNSDIGGGGDFDIHVSRSTDLGQTWTDPQLLLPDMIGDNFVERGPQYVTDRAGNWVTVWHALDRDHPESGYDVFVSRSVDNGRTWSDRFHLNAGGTYNQADPSAKPQLATDRNGHWVVVWHSKAEYNGQFGFDMDIYVSRSNNAGETWSDVEALDVTRADLDSGNDKDAQIAVNQRGVWITVWHSNDSFEGTIGPDDDVLFSRSLDNGVTWSPAAPLNTNAAVDQGADRFAFVDCDDDAWIVAWFSDDTLNGQIGADADILYSRSVDDGLTWSDPAPLNTNAALDIGEDQYPYITTDELGNWVATWRSDDDLNGLIGRNTDVLVSRSSDDGLTWTYPEPFNQNAYSNSGENHYLHTATNGDGDWLGVWRSTDDPTGELGDDWDVFVANFMLPPNVPYSLELSHLFINEEGLFKVRGATPDAMQHLLYSLVGEGSTPVPQLNVVLDLANPSRAAHMTADDAGRVDWLIRIPSAALDRRLWFQCAEDGRTTNVFTRMVRSR